MTTTHSHCTHPVTKAARAKCRKERGSFYAQAMSARKAKAKPEPKAQPKPVVLETCCCKGKPSGFTCKGDNMWVCADCDRPTKQYALNVLMAAVA